MTRSHAETAQALALAVKVADAEIATVAATETDLASHRVTSLLRVQLLRPKLTVTASTSVRQLRALATEPELVVETTLRSSQKLENPGHWSGFSF
jgi:hypothetical protein